jgi:phospho-N-acetylmuramoyl-pentapeptide-transferase
MLFALLEPLSDMWFPFNVFRYITFRTACAAITALALTLLLAPWVVDRLRRGQIGQRIRSDGPPAHSTKEGTPTMGGLLIVSAVVVSTVLWMDASNRFVWVALGGMVGFAVIGFIDDYLNVVHARKRGFSVRSKFIGEILISLLVGGALLAMSFNGLFDTRLAFPFFKELSPTLGWWYLPFAVLVLVATSNAVNLTDGLDGLATGSMLVASGTYLVFAYLAGHVQIAEYLNILYVSGVGEVTVFCGAMVGACLGFLWYNCFPAEVFMGDTGSLALGGAIGTVALLIKQELALLLVGGLFVVEALSVIVQVGSFKLTGKRPLRMAPLHHHFEMSGWSEPKVIVRFWILAILFAMLSLATLKLR